MHARPLSISESVSTRWLSSSTASALRIRKLTFILPLSAFLYCQTSSFRRINWYRSDQLISPIRSFRYFFSANSIPVVHIESRYSHSAACSADNGEVVYSWSACDRENSHAYRDRPLARSVPRGPRLLASVQKRGLWVASRDRKQWFEEYLASDTCDHASTKCTHRGDRLE